ncbi:MAG: Tm-1-like ATP-binding domain-containing protein [Planctomycetales bacterium]
MSVYLLATLDTKGREAAFTRDQLESHGVKTILVDVGSGGEPFLKSDVTREEVFQAAGATLAEVQQRNDRGQAVTLAAVGAATLIKRLHAEGKVSGVFGLGGSAGTVIGTAAMRELPLGIPKVMVSTLASGQVQPYVRDKDVAMFNSVVDLLGVNRISRLILSQAARAMAGMVSLPAPEASSEDRPLVAATMFGVTTPCVERARETLEQAGYEVLVFHATGSGGKAMESLISDGLIAGVLDITTTELADELVGGVLSAGPDRLTAAGIQGTPQVISVGATDMVNFGSPDSIPEQFKDRRFHQHNAEVTLMRTTKEECSALGKQIAAKAKAAKGPTSIILPLQGVSAIDKSGESFDDPQAREALFESLRANRGDVELIETDCHINDEDFAERAAKRLIEMMS